MTRDALIVVDVQIDFLPGGSLAVPDGDAVIAPLNRVISRFADAGLPIVATRDWHPSDHCSFEAQGGPWPPHCVAETAGAAFDERLRLPDTVKIVSKAASSEAEAYSGFQGTDLESWLRAQGVSRIVVGGLATDYCVKSTVEDALNTGFEVMVLEDAVRAVNVQPGDDARALEAMESRGARRVSSGEITPAHRERG